MPFSLNKAGYTAGAVMQKTPKNAKKKLRVTDRPTNIAAHCVALHTTKDKLRARLKGRVHPSNQQSMNSFLPTRIVNFSPCFAVFE